MDDDDLLPHELEQLRRSVVMVAPGRPCGLDRERALQLIGQLQRVQRHDSRYRQLLGQLRALVAALDDL